jgi:glycosyltransferase involved in cell wall biosynthesis
MSRWLLVTQDFPPGFTGGIASWADDLASALSAAGEQVEVFARRTGDTQAGDSAAPYPIIRMRGRSWNTWQGWWALRAVWPRLSSDVRVICATWPLATQLSGHLRGARLAVAFHGSDLSRLTAAPPALKHLTRRADAFLPVSGYLADRLRTLCPDTPPERIHVLPMPLAHPPQPAAPRREELVVLSRLTPLKAIERAIAIAHALGRPLRIIGDGPARPALEAAASDTVTFAGRQDRASALSALEGAAGLLLLPRAEADGTGAEGLGLCLIEAALRDVPGIGCRTGGVPEALGPGLLLDNPDAPDLERLARFLSDPSQGPAARAWACEHHGPEATVRALRTILP